MAKGGLIEMVVSKLPPPDKLKKMSGEREEPDDSGDDTDEGAGKASAKDDIKAAAKAGDWEAMADAIADLVDICVGEYMEASKDSKD